MANVPERWLNCPRRGELIAGKVSKLILKTMLKVFYNVVVALKCCMSNLYGRQTKFGSYVTDLKIVYIYVIHVKKLILYRDLHLERSNPYIYQLQFELH